MPHEISPSLPASESPYDDPPRSVWVYYPRHMLEHPEPGSEQCLDYLPEKSESLAAQSTGGKVELDEDIRNEVEAPQRGHSLFQEMFFFCTVKRVGDIPAAGCIHVETVVDR